VAEQRPASGDLHPGRPARRGQRLGRLLPPRAGGEPQGRRAGQGPAAQAAGGLSPAPTRRSRWPRTTDRAPTPAREARRPRRRPRAARAERRAADMAEPVPAGSDVSAGTYRCTNCGNTIDVSSTQSLPPCPNCANGEWSTVTGGDAAADPYPDG